MGQKHFCSFSIGGLKCPKLGVVTGNARPESNSRWFCQFHFDARNRKTDYCAQEILRTMIADVRDGKAPRGSTAVARETDLVMERQLAELNLTRRNGEARLDFIARCKAKMKSGRLTRRIVARISADEIERMLAAGEDPFLDAGEVDGLNTDQ